MPLSKISLDIFMSPLTATVAIVLGAAFGYYYPDLSSTHLAMVGAMFLALLKICIIPLMFTAVSSGLARLMHSRQMFAYFKVIAIVFLIGLCLSSLFGIVLGAVGQTGAAFDQFSKDEIGSILLQSDVMIPNDIYAGTVHSFMAMLSPENLLATMIKDHNLALLSVAVIFGLALGFGSDESRELTLSVMDGIFDIFVTLVKGIICVLPIALFCLFANQVAATGFVMVFVLLKLIFYTYLGCFILMFMHVFIISKRLSISMLHVLRFAKKTLVISFVTASSFAALPFAIKSLEDKFHLDKDNVNLFYPLTICFNPQGSAFFFSLAILFIAQLYGVPIDLRAFAIIFFGGTLASLIISGAPAVAGLSMLSMVFVPLGLPLSAAVILLVTVTHILDPVITMTNTTGNFMAMLIAEQPRQALT